MIYVTSDLHGYPLHDFFQLLDKAKFSDSDDLIVLGDVIDRNGDGGIAMLRWMLQQANVRMILGNHEAMLLSCRFLFDAITDESLAQFDQKNGITVYMDDERCGAAPESAEGFISGG